MLNTTGCAVAPPLAIRITDLGGNIYEATELAKRIRAKLFGADPQNEVSTKEQEPPSVVEYYVTKHECALQNLSKILCEIAERLGA